MKKLISVLLIGLLSASMVFAAAGCGEKDSDNNKKSSSNTSTTSAAQSTTYDNGIRTTTQPVTSATADGSAQSGDAVVNAARNYFGLGSDAQVNVLDTVELEDGSLYYHVQIPMGEGVSELYVHSSGYPVYLPEAFNSQFFGTNSDAQQSNDSESDYNSAESYADNGGNAQQSYNTGDDKNDSNNFNGPDGASL